ncbi:MAG: hypothetical protein IKQ82_02040 [Lentisphaeria bacterium]|nr:hypothetical protein [Lentisphaeria bacterium]
MNTYNIYGDNIVECERMLVLLQKALNSHQKTVVGNPPAITIHLSCGEETFSFHFFPGFGRWDNDIIASIRNSGGVLREAPDIIITKIENNTEFPVLAIEFCSALPAGNQAWQRSGRAYSIARTNIPYLFITEIGGYELDSNRNRKAPRMPNPAIPFSFISYSKMTSHEVMITYLMNPGADQANRSLYQDVIAGDELLGYIRAKIVGQSGTSLFNSLLSKAFLFVTKLAARSNSKSLNPNQWQIVYQDLLLFRNTNRIIDESTFQRKKRITIPTTRSFSFVFQTIQNIATAVASGDLPFCVIREENVPQMIQLIRQQYPHFSNGAISSLSGNGDIAVCWINGFKPGGDDARPDRGLLPFLRMLLGDSIKVLTFVYGPAPSTMIHRLSEDPQRLARENGLWEAVISLSDLIICDSRNASIPVCQTGFMRSLPQAASQVSMPQNTRLFPVEEKTGENDVDSVIHLLFSELLKTQCFESMCNPPGGDWSGVSLQNNGTEYRWLTLPRVSATDSKRPDHIIQLPNGILISIESKDYLSHLERNIGPRLNQYCQYLFSTPPSCKRLIGSNWTDDVGRFVSPVLRYVSGSAFIETSNRDLSRVLQKANTDFAFVIDFSCQITTLKIVYRSSCPNQIRNLFRSIRIPSELNIRIQVRSVPVRHHGQSIQEDHS